MPIDVTLPGGLTLALAPDLILRVGAMLLMLWSVLLYSTACLGLNIQFGYAGVANFAGAAFFGIGSYTPAVLAAHSALPQLLVILFSGMVAAVIGSVLR